MGDGSSGDPPIGPAGDSGSSSSSEDDSQQSGLDDHSPEESNESETPSETTPSDSEGGSGSGGAPVAPPPTTEDPSTDEPEDGDGEEHEPEPPERDPNPEPEPEQPDPPQDPPEIDDAEDMDEEEDDDDEEEDEQKAQVVVHSDAWDTVGLGLYPIRYQLKEEYGDQVQIDDRLVPVREFEVPGEMTQQWERESRRHEMPVDSSIWDADPPESTKRSNRAYAAAREQDISLAKSYMRRLRMAAIVEGRNIEDRETLIELAAEVGLDTDQLEEDWNDVKVRTTTRDVETPKTTIHVDGETITQPGYLHVDDLKMMFEQAGLEKEDPQQPFGFVEEYGPVAVKEVQQVYNLTREETIEELRQTDGVYVVEIGQGQFWVPNRS